MASAVLEELCCVFSSFRFFRVFVASLVKSFVGVFLKASHFLLAFYWELCLQYHTKILEYHFRMLNDFVSC